MAGLLRTTQNYTTVLGRDAGNLRTSQVYVSVLALEPPDALLRTSQVCVSTLVRGPSSLRVSQVYLTVLVESFIPEQIGSGVGVFADLLSTSKTLDQTPEITPLDRYVLKEFQRRVDAGDAPYIEVLKERNEVQEIAAFTGTVIGGNYTITINLWGGDFFTTANIPYNAEPEDVAIAIDQAAIAAGLDWENNTINITGDDLLNGSMTLTYSGTLVKNRNHGQATIQDIDLAGGGLADPPQSIILEGQSYRPQWGVLIAEGIIDSSAVPSQGETPLLFSTNYPTGPNALTQHALRTIAEDAAIIDNNPNVGTVILASLGL